MTFRNYSPDEYRATGINAGPFALEGNPDPEKRNYRTNRDRSPGGIIGGVMHITAGLSDYTLPDVSAEGTTRYGADTTRDASWHVCVDSDGIIPSVRDAYTAWHAGVSDIPGMNDATLGMEIGTGATDWRKKPDAWVQRTIRNAAVWWAPRVVKYGIPIRVENDRDVIAAAVKAGRKFGFTSHKIIQPSMRTDPGWVDTNGNGVADTDTFPWSMFFAYLREEIDLLTNPAAPTQEDDMTNVTDAEKANLLGAAERIPRRYRVLDKTTNTWKAADKGDAGAVESRVLDDLDGQTLRNDIAAVKAQLGALTSVIGELAKGQPLTVEQITAAAKAGADEALDERITNATTTTVLTVDPPSTS